MIFSQLKADVSHSGMGKTILETATLDSNPVIVLFQELLSSLKAVLCLPLLLANSSTSSSSSSEMGPPRCVFYQLDSDAERYSSN